MTHMKDRGMAGAPGEVVNLPLPGMYPVLTAQINITCHPKTGLSKWVCILREPMDQLEIVRVHQDLDDWHATRSGLVRHLADLIASLEYLSGFGPGLSSSQNPM